MMTPCVGCLPTGGRRPVGSLCGHRGTRQSAGSQPSWATSLLPFSPSGKRWVFWVTLWQRWTLQAEWPVSLFSAEREHCHSRHWRSFLEVVVASIWLHLPEGTTLDRRCLSWWLPGTSHSCHAASESLKQGPHFWIISFTVLFCFQNRRDARSQPIFRCN